MRRQAIAPVGRPGDRKVLTAFVTWRVMRVRREAERRATGRTALRTTMRYDRARVSLDRHATCIAGAAR